MNENIAKQSASSKTYYIRRFEHTIGSCLTKPCNRGHDNAVVQLSKNRVIESKGLHHSGLKILDQDICPLGELLENIPPRRTIEV